MAYEPLKDIKFPGIANTFTVPTVDNTLAVQGAAADAKAVGDEISDIKADFNDLDKFIIGIREVGKKVDRSTGKIVSRGTATNTVCTDGTLQLRANDIISCINPDYGVSIFRFQTSVTGSERQDSVGTLVYEAEGTFKYTITEDGYYAIEAHRIDGTAITSANYYSAWEYVLLYRKLLYLEADSSGIYHIPVNASMWNNGVVNAIDKETLLVNAASGRADFFFRTQFPFTINANGEYQYAVFKYEENKTINTVYSHTGYITDDYNIPVPGAYLIQMKKSDGSNIDENDISAFINGFTFTINDAASVESLSAVNPKYPHGALADADGNVVWGFPEIPVENEISRLTVVNPKYPYGAIVDGEGKVMMGVPSFDYSKSSGKEIIIDISGLEGKKISILGDSISTFNGAIPSGYATYYPRGDVTSLDNTWWMKVITAVDAELCTNASWSGSTVSGDLTTDTTAKPGCGNQRISDLANNGTPDIIFCYISTNDWGKNVLIGEFDSTDPMPVDGNITEISYAYALMLYKIRTTYPNADVFCLTSTFGRQHGSDQDQAYPWLNANGESLHQLNHAISEIAHMFGCGVVDLETCGIHPWNAYNYMVDETVHPNNAGTTLIANAVLRELKNWYGG